MMVNWIKLALARRGTQHAEVSIVLALLGPRQASCSHLRTMPRTMERTMIRAHSTRTLRTMAANLTYCETMMILIPSREVDTA